MKYFSEAMFEAARAAMPDEWKTLSMTVSENKYICVLHADGLPDSEYFAIVYAPWGGKAQSITGTRPVPAYRVYLPEWEDGCAWCGEYGGWVLPDESENLDLDLDAENANASYPDFAGALTHIVLWMVEQSLSGALRDAGESEYWAQYNSSNEENV